MSSSNMRFSPPALLDFCMLVLGYIAVDEEGDLVFVLLLELADGFWCWFGL
jgi:hypothetical protein